MSLIQVVSLRAGIQSDGALAGHPAVIVETGPVSETMSPAELLAQAQMLAGGPCLISIVGTSGSDPAIQPLDELIDLGQEDGFRFAAEIHGNEAPEWLESLDYLTVTPSTPSDGVTTNYKTLHQVMGAGMAGKPKLSILVAIADDADFAFAEMLHELFPPVDFYVTPGCAAHDETGYDDIFDYLEHARWIAETVIERQQPDMRLTLDLAALAGVKAGV